MTVDFLGCATGESRQNPGNDRIKRRLPAERLQSQLSLGNVPRCPNDADRRAIVGTQEGRVDLAPERGFSVTITASP